MSEFGQNPSKTAISTIPTKFIKQISEKNKISKRSAKLKNNNNTFDHECNNKPPKVVHISNPMRFQVKADEFRALVQGLTGRNAAEWTEYYDQVTSTTTTATTNTQGVVAETSGYNEVDLAEVHKQELEQFDNDHHNYQVDYSGSSDLSLDNYNFGGYDNNGDVMCEGVEYESYSNMGNMECYQPYMRGNNL